MAILAKAIYTFSAIPVKLTMAFFFNRTGKKIWKQKTPNNQRKLEKGKWNWRNLAAQF